VRPSRLIHALALILPLAAAPARAAEPLVADLSRHLVAITAGFSGSDVLLFGAVEGDGDVVVVVRGPVRRETVWRKRQRFGIWINTGRAVIEGAPSFYRVAATRAPERFARPEALASQQIGLDHLTMTIDVRDGSAPPGEYRAALLRAKQRQGLYGDSVDEIGFLGRRLFRTDMHFPGNVPVGTYLIEVFLFVDGQVVSAQTTPLIVSKIGLGADLYDFAHQHAASYGIIAVLLAAASGWLAAIAFRKG
jgi:uncharacterized protein (TIGR02186 family)